MSDGYMAWVAIALLGLWSCAGVLIRISKVNAKRLDKIIELLKQIDGAR